MKSSLCHAPSGEYQVPDVPVDPVWSRRQQTIDVGIREIGLQQPAPARDQGKVTNV